jgi:LacI family transcriptional regulator
MIADVKQFRVTIKDIAAEAGLSNQAVSYALRRDPRIPPATRDRVVAIAERLGYRPNASAQAFRNGRHGSVGLLLSATPARSYLPAHLLYGIENALTARSTRLIIGDLPDERLAQQGAAPSLLRNWSIDGLLINYQEDVPETMCSLIRRDHVPSVWINTRQEGGCVHADDLAAARAATDYLLQLGHRRIAYVDYSRGWDRLADAHYSARDRQAGYEAAMVAAGLAPRIIRERQMVPGRERAERAKVWLSQPDRPTAIIASGGTVAFPVCFQARLLGLNVPADLSLISVDDVPVDMMGQVFTTMVVPHRKIGEAAAEMLLRILNEKDFSPTALAVAFDFERGETCAPPPV